MSNEESPCNSAVRYVILEDVFYTAREIQMLVNRLRPEYKLIGIAEDFLEATLLIEENEVDLAICDIELSDATVFDVLDALTADKAELPLIFISSNEKYKEKCFNKNTVAFLLEPLIKEELSEAMLKYEGEFALPHTK